jgi:K+-sensing histidine kinase KdpD
MLELLWTRWIGSIATAAIAVALTTAVLLGLYLVSAPEHLIFGYLVPTSFIALRYGSVAAIITALACTVCAAFFLYPPDFDIRIAQPLHMAELAFFLLLTLATSQFIGGLADDDRLGRRASLLNRR